MSLPGGIEEHSDQTVRARCQSEHERPVRQHPTRRAHAEDGGQIEQQSAVPPRPRAECARANLVHEPRRAGEQQDERKAHHEMGFAPEQRGRGVGEPECQRRLVVVAETHAPPHCDHVRLVDAQPKRNRQPGPDDYANADEPHHLAAHQRCLRGVSERHHRRTRPTQLNALSPVTACPRTSVWMSCVPSYVYTLSRFSMWRIDAYSARIPFAPSSRRASRAISVAMLTLLRLASDTCCGVNVPASLSRPRCNTSSGACAIPVSISASRACWI